jgi:hypothetical protein
MKIGDTAKIISVDIIDKNHGLGIGQLVTITYLSSDMIEVKRNEDSGRTGSYWLHKNKVEVIEKPTDGFKLGDLVELVSPNVEDIRKGLATGDIGKVVCATYNGLLTIEFDKINPDSSCESRMFSIFVHQLKLASSNTTSSEPPTPTTPFMSTAHYSQKSTLDILAAGEYPILVGPTGSGKTTTVVNNILPLLGIPPEQLTIVQISRETSRYDLLGYRSANGTPVQGLLTDILLRGEGLILIDELDKGNENTLLVLKGFFAGRIESPFGVHTIDKTKLKLIATANTIGAGASLDYNAAVKQDQALTNEFITVPWDYDREFENTLVRDLCDGITERVYYKKDTDYLVGCYNDSFQDLRQACKKASSSEIFSARQLRQAVNLMLRADWDFSAVIKATSLRECDETTAELYTKEILPRWDKKFRGVVKAFSDSPTLADKSTKAATYEKLPPKFSHGETDPKNLF